jgi:hypothetical protein
MIGKGSLVRYKGEEKKNLWPGRMLMVHEREGDKVVVWDERKSLTEWTTKTVSVNDLEEVQK